jgi:hypothetical protein
MRTRAFLVPGLLRETDPGDTIQSAGRLVRLTHVGCAAVTARCNVGSFESTIARGSTFSESTDPSVALWSEASLTGENGYTIIKTCEGGRNFGYMLRLETVAQDHPPAVMLDATTFPGVYIILTQSDSGCSPAESLHHHEDERKSRLRTPPLHSTPQERNMVHRPTRADSPTRDGGYATMQRYADAHLLAHQERVRQRPSQNLAQRQTTEGRTHRHRSEPPLVRHTHTRNTGRRANRAFIAARRDWTCGRVRRTTWIP